jgi:hypothetical protein
MNPDDLDQILLSDKKIAASATFPGVVMARIQLEAVLTRPASFPWIRFAAVLLVVSIPIIWFFPYGMAVRSMNSLCNTMEKAVLILYNLAVPDSLLTVCAAIFGTLILVWLSLQLVGAKS